MKYTCPKCKEKIEVETEQTSGTIQITCTNPNCGFKFLGNIKEKSPADTENPKPARPDNSAKAPQPAAEKLKAEEDGDVTCPHCGYSNHVTGKETAGIKIVGCQYCKGPIEVTFMAKTATVDGSYPYRGKIVVQRFLMKKEYPLGIKKNLIGRADKDSPSDIMLKDDTVSRQSAEIEVKIGEKGGFYFHFRVRNAKNPVLVNNRRVEPGEEILLNYGDIITMGKTRLRFDKIL